MGDGGCNESTFGVADGLGNEAVVPENTLTRYFNIQRMSRQMHIALTESIRPKKGQGKIEEFS